MSKRVGGNYSTSADCRKFRREMVGNTGCTCCKENQVISFTV